MVPPYAPFFPGSYHNGADHQFSIGLEGGNFVADVFEEAHRVTSLSRLERICRRELGVHARALDDHRGTSRKRFRMDLHGARCHSCAQRRLVHWSGDRKADRSQVRFERYINRRSGYHLEAVRSISVKRVGYSGLMLPPLEDPVLAQRWSEGTYDLDSLLAYSAVCGTGLDTVPLPGDVSQEQLERIIGDVASLAVQVA